MFKRLSLFLITNMAVILAVSLIINLLGVEPYLTANGINYQSLLIMCGVWGMVGSFISLAISKWSAKRMMGVQIINPQMGGEHAAFINTVHRLAKAADLPKMPEVGIYNSPEVNAFATGPSKSNSLVAVSTGLLNNMREDELEGVLAHEVAHIANGDMVTMTLIQGVVNAFVMFFAHIAVMAIDNLMSGDDNEGEGLGFFTRYMLINLFTMVFGLLAMPVIGFFSRYREYKADSGGAHLAGRDKMINALKRLQQQHEQGVFEKADSNINAMKISSKSNGLMALMSTHPPLSDRIKALEMNAR